MFHSIVWLSCLLPNHISRVSKPVLDGTTWMGWGHTQSTDSPPASAASTWFPLHCCFFLLRCLFLWFCLREGTSTIYGQHGHHSFDSSLLSPSNHIGQGRKLWHQIQNSKPCISKTCHAQPQYSSSGIPANVLDGLPSQNFYQPEKSPNIPILPGERRQYLFWLRLKLYHSKDQIKWPFSLQVATTTTMVRWCVA